MGTCRFDGIVLYYTLYSTKQSYALIIVLSCFHVQKYTYCPTRQYLEPTYSQRHKGIQLVLFYCIAGMIFCEE